MSDQANITLTTHKQLDIYMNPQRQRLLKFLEIQGPMTSKQLSGLLGISPSSVLHHIRQLEGLGLVQLDHTESIHGIQAKFYKKLPVSVSLGGDRDDDLRTERFALMDSIISELWNSFKAHLKDPKTIKGGLDAGDFTSGVVHLRDEDAEKLYHMILDFTDAHAVPGEGTIPWEYGFIAFPHRTRHEEK